MIHSVRHAAIALATIAVSLPGAALARGVAVRVVIVAPVSAPATAVMPPALWRRLIARYVGGTAIPLAESPAPTASDCRAAGADLLVTAPFALAPKLPGLPGSSDGRVSATTHLIAISCATGAVVLDRIVPLESDPPSDEEAGDFERDPELVWDHGVEVALARGRIDNALVRRQATIALAASVRSADSEAKATPSTPDLRARGSRIPIFAATPLAQAAAPQSTSIDRASVPTDVPTTPAAAVRTSATPEVENPAQVAMPVASATPDVTIERTRAPEHATAEAVPRPAATPVVPTAAPARHVAVRDVTTAPIARLVDLIDVSRIAGVTQPFAILNVRDPSLQAGDRLVDFADASHVLRAKPIDLTVTENFGTYVQIVFDATGDAPVPAKGDLVQRAPATP